MTISRSIEADGVCTLAFDRPDSSANIFDRATLEELDAHIAFIEAEKGVTGVILTSAKPRIFIAGADLNSFARASGEAELAPIIDLGHRVFTRLSLLPVPSAAAIAGACLGGGCEVALACDWRAAAIDPATRIGLPETQLGIVPAWGGCVRMPALIGLPAALGLILTGRQVPAAQARKLGLVDAVAHREYLVASARRLLLRGKRRPLARGWLSRPPLSWWVAAKARRGVLAKTRGHYPAPLKAIEVCAGALGSSREAGFRLERAAFLELLRTPSAHHLISVFFLQERSRKLQAPGAGGAAGARVGRAAVIGAGVMGAGIAQWVSARGVPVVLKDVGPDALARGLATAAKLYAEGAKRKTFTAVEARAGLDRIVPAHEDVPLANIDLIIEAAAEKLDVKRSIFLQIEARAGPGAVLATNTSSLSIDAIADGLARPERVVGIHFFNPVHRMQLVEIVRGPRTSPAALATALQFVKQIGKLPVIVKDSPGFLVNRILLPYMVEALWLFHEGCGVEEIDRLMLDFGMPMGPLRLSDEVGLDVAQHVAKELERGLPKPVPVSDALEKMVAKGWLGKKSGRGFYLFEKRGKERVNPDLGFARKAGGAPAGDAATRLDRMVLIMVNEAARCLEEGVVEAPEDVDFGMIMGTGWAPFRGGPLRYADSLGAEAIVRRLEGLEKTVAPHFSPCRRLVEMAGANGRFYPT